MTDIKIYEREIIRFRAQFLICIFAAVCLGAWLGFGLGTYESCIIIPRSPFSGGSFTGLAKICFSDIISFWIISVPLTKGVKLFASFAVFLFRGMIISTASRIFFANSVDPLCVLILVSYIAVTLLLVIYDGYINTTGEKSTPARILSCFIATGGAAIVRILPMLLIK